MVLAIYGAGGLGREIYDTVISQQKPEWDRIVFVDDFSFDRHLNGVDVVSLPQLVVDVGIGNFRVIIGIGEPSVRAKIWERVKSMHDNYSDALVSVIHPNTIISPTSHIGHGVYIGPFSFVSSNAVIGDNVLIQPHAMIGHDVVVGCSSVISTNAVIAGDCSIGERTYVALNVSVEQNVKIGDDTIVGMASCVNKNIPSEVIAMGYPARVLKTNERKKVF